MKQSNVLKESLGNFLRNAYDLLALNWLWLLCSLPVVTIGPATAAVYAVTLELAREEPVSVGKDFFRAFREGFRQSTVLGLLGLALTVVSAVDALFALEQSGIFQTVFLIVTIVMGMAALTVFGLALPLQAMYANTLKKHLLNAFSLVFVFPGKALTLWLVLLLPLLLALALPPIAVKMLGFLYIMYGVSLPLYVNSRRLRTIFSRVSGEVGSSDPPIIDKP